MYKYKYILILLDDYTRYECILFTNSNEKIFNIFFKWDKKIRNIFNKSIKYIRNDNGQNSKIHVSKNSKITKALYNSSLSHTTHNKMAVPKDSTEQLLIQQKSY